MIHQNLNLHITNGSFIIEPQTNEKVKNNLIIEKSTGNVSLGEYTLGINSEKVIPIYGIFGTIQINSGTVLIVITEKEKIGEIYGTEIFKVKKVGIYPNTKNDSRLTQSQKNDDQVYLSMISEVFKQCNFYFSYQRDITHNAQIKFDVSAPIWSTADERFYWNQYMQKPIINLATQNPNAGFDDFILPVICGFCAIRPTAINNQPFVFAIISRRSRFRAGTRYNRRGIDDEGNVANYVETEQYVYLESSKQTYSYVQTRGSIPLYWQQIINVKYYPRLFIEPNISTKDSFRKHFQDQRNRYGGQIILNLINKHGYELHIGNEFAKQVEDLHDDRITYVHFDFHKECSKMRWHRISLLMDQIEDNLIKQGYYHVNENGQIVQEQTSVCRTNCMDCLDRTNVVQSVLAKRALNHQLRESGVLGPQQKVEDAPEFIFTFNNVWADNANAMSIQYSGTNALKTDFTRTGKRTKMGAMNDLQNSIVRYVKNNFKDGSRQDGFDFFLGNYVVNPSLPSPFINIKSPRAKFLPFALVGSIFMFFVSIFGRREFSASALVEILFWALLIVGVCQQIFSNGEDFVNKPSLIKPAYSAASHQYGGGAPIQLDDINIRKDKEK
ncbi:Phosphatidylinositide phosphatase SAC1 [Piromyces finnis]|uniref:Phosphatidylinositide phosphatase SAC1 n=1 Tax=Piromyces finnis TaxID=1754191 RepID=A0A1Y1VA25_9FUNG|nr:Phosphatidylinositide phosphatase SAC1 [Piromyces finnis]|eukprot:ORX50742.1 Phosphatidylinositide phosphatase SAC1 [Piromyces finnis]